MVEPVRLPCLLARLDDDRGEILAELVGVNLEPPMFRRFEGEGEGGERLRRAEPDEAAWACLDVRLEYFCVPIASLAVDAVGGNDEVRVGEFLFAIDLVLKRLKYPEFLCPFLEYGEESLAPNAAEAVAAAQEPPSGEMNGDIVPMMKVAENSAVRDRIGGPKVLHGLIGEYHAPPERVVGPIALVYLDSRQGQGFAQQDRCVQSRGAAAQAYNPFHDLRNPRYTYIASRSAMIY